MPNGAKITVDMRNQIVATQEELDRAKQEHGYNANDNVVVKALPKRTARKRISPCPRAAARVRFHEAFHVARSMALTDKEKAALDKILQRATKKAS